MSQENNTILIVDDLPENIDILRAILSAYNSKVAINGKMALKVAEKTLPDLILLDIIMPDMNGFEVASILKKNDVTKNIPVIFVTAENEAQNIAKEYNFENEEFIHKPFEPETVLAVIKKFF